MSKRKGIPSDETPYRQSYAARSETINPRRKGRAKNRGNGNGTVYKLPDGRSRWQVTVGFDQDAKQLRVGGIVENKTAGERAISQAITDHSRNALVLPNDVTVADYVERWLQRQKAISETTRASYRTVLGYTLPHIGHYRVSEVRTVHVRETLMRLADLEIAHGLGKGRTLSSRTLTQVRRLLRAVFREAIEDDLLYKDPTAVVKRVKPNVTEHPGVALDLHEIERFREVGEALHEAGLCRFWAALFTALNTGLRRGELMALRWKNIDLEVGALQVRENLTVLGGKPILKATTKTRAGQRTVPIPASLNAVLKRHRMELETELALSGIAFTPDTPVFATAQGLHTHPDNLNRALRDLLEWSKAGLCAGDQNDRPGILLEKRMRGVDVQYRARLRTVIADGTLLPRISPHDLRHTCGSLWLRNGVPFEVVAKWLGHEDVSVTLRVYRHVLPSEEGQYRVDFFAPLPLSPR